MQCHHAGVIFAFVFAAAPAVAQNIKIALVGSHPGELCANDRATIFEDPSGVRILYDAGHTVTGGDDPRPGDIHVVLLSHAHGDHIGDQKLKAVGAGSCANSERVPAGPNSTTADVAGAKNAAIVTNIDIGTFIARKVQNFRGKPVGVCPLRPASITLTHTNEAVTDGGKLRPNSRTAALIKQLQASAYPAISGRTMEFDSRGKCVAGC